MAVESHTRLARKHDAKASAPADHDLGAGRPIEAIAVEKNVLAKLVFVDPKPLIGAGRGDQNLSRRSRLGMAIPFNPFAGDDAEVIDLDWRKF
jgi:hypothetical protein